MDLLNINICMSVAIERLYHICLDHGYTPTYRDLQLGSKVMTLDASHLEVTYTTPYYHAGVTVEL